MCKIGEWFILHDENGVLTFNIQWMEVILIKLIWIRWLWDEGNVISNIYV